MEDGLAAISAHNQCPTDAAIAFQVRIQLLAQKAVQIHQQQQLETGQAPADTSTFPVVMCLGALQGQLQELQASLPPALSQQELVMAHIYTTEVCINQAMYAVSSMVPLMVSAFTKIAASRPMGTTTRSGPLHERSQYLWQCVRAGKDCISSLMALSPLDTAGISFVQWSQLTRCIAVLNHLTTAITDVAWDRTAVRTLVEKPLLLDRAAEKLRLAAQAVGEQEHDDVFTQLSRTIRAFRSDVPSSVARGQNAAEERDDVWMRSRSYGGGGTGVPLSIMPLLGGIGDAENW